jgi:hypothetical protein
MSIELSEFLKTPQSNDAVLEAGFSKQSLPQARQRAKVFTFPFTVNKKTVQFNLHTDVVIERLADGSDIVVEGVTLKITKVGTKALLFTDVTPLGKLLQKRAILDLSVGSDNKRTIHVTQAESHAVAVALNPKMVKALTLSE